MLRTPFHSTPENPRAPIAAPMSPPNRAWEELDGRPRSQVSRFQTMPPIRPEKTTSRSLSASATWERSKASRSTMPFATVLATSTERKAPTRLRPPASATATFGLSAPVAMEVAIALAVSWKPLVKSNARAVPITRMRISTSVVTPEESLVSVEISIPCRAGGCRWRWLVNLRETPGDTATMTAHLRRSQYVCECDPRWARGIVGSSHGIYAGQQFDDPRSISGSRCPGFTACSFWAGSGAARAAVIPLGEMACVTAPGRVTCDKFHSIRACLPTPRRRVGVDGRCVGSSASVVVRQ